MREELLLQQVTMMDLKRNGQNLHIISNISRYKTFSFIYDPSGPAGSRFDPASSIYDTVSSRYHPTSSRYDTFRIPGMILLVPDMIM